MSAVWVTRVPAGVRVLRVLPDAAVDLVFSGDRLVVAGPDTVACLEQLPPGPVLGFQLRPGAVPAVLGAPASAMRDLRVNVAQLWGAGGRDLVEMMLGADTLSAKADRLEQFLLRRSGDAVPDPVAAALGQRLRAGDSAVSDFGLGDRQLRRRSLAAFGYGPQMLRRILRFQDVLSRLPTADGSVAELAVDCGYVDQAHLAHEVAAFSGLTPRALRAALLGEAGMADRSAGSVNPGSRQ